MRARRGNGLFFVQALLNSGAPTSNRPALSRVKQDTVDLCYVTPLSVTSIRIIILLRIIQLFFILFREALPGW